MKKNLANSIRVSSPCGENWNEMKGDKKVRFCSHCDLDVANISEMTRREALRLAKRSDGKLCVRYVEHPQTNAPVFADKLHQIGRRAGIAAGVLGASLAVSTATFAQGAVSLNVKTLNEKSKTISVTDDKKSNFKEDKTATIFGTVYDSQKAVIPNSLITLTNKKNNQKLSLRSNEFGVYEFKNIAPATYTIEFDSPGFKKFIAEKVQVNSQNSVELDASLQVYAIMGDVTISIVRTPFENAIIDGNAKLVQQFISRGENVNQKDPNGEGSTPLHLAVENGKLEIVQILLNSGADVNAKNSYESAPLIEITENTSPEIIRLLVKYGAKIDTTDEFGATALMRAAEEENFEAVKALLESGANPNAKNSEGKTARDLASDEKTEKLLESYGAIVEDN